MGEWNEETLVHDCLSNSVSIKNRLVLRRCLLSIASILDLGFFLSKIDSRVVILFEFLEQIETWDNDFFTVKGDSERVSSQSYLLDSSLVVANEASE